MPSNFPPRTAHDLAEDDLRRRVKRELRKRARGVRNALPLEACQKRSLAIIARLLDLPAMRDARAVALFWPIVDRHEVDLRSLDTALRERGVRIAYPRVVAEAGLREMSFHFVDDASELREEGHGFAEPPASAPRVRADLAELDVVVVPALALDPSGQRIGYGAGFYDGALAGTAVVKAGVAFDFQLVAEVPATDGDVAVDWIVTDTRTLAASPLGAEDLASTPMSPADEKEGTWSM